MAKKYEYEVLRVHPEYKQLLLGLVSESTIKNQIEYVEKMILYFKETGIDPVGKIKSTGEELSKLRNTVISFIRELEQKKLTPLINDFSEVAQYLLNYLKNEAVTRKDLFTALHVEPPQTIKDESSKEIKSDKEKAFSTRDQIMIDEKYKNMVSHVRGLFDELKKNVKPATFGSAYTIDKNIFERIKKNFEAIS